MREAPTQKTRKHVFFVPLVLIGIGIGFLLSSWVRNAFVACVFIGMGLGSLLDSIFVVEDGLHRSFSFLSALLGSVFILIGLILLFKPSLLEVFGSYIAAVSFIALGVYLLIRRTKQ